MSSAGGNPSKSVINALEITTYPKAYALKDHDNPFSHIEFALKYEGINLSILNQLFKKLPKEAAVSYILEQPSGKYTRKIWFLYEFLMQCTLDVPDCKMGNYFALLDEKLYYAAPNRPSKRHRIHNNLLGNAGFCPIVRRTAVLLDFEKRQLDKVATNLLANYDYSTLSRAAHYLYAKETRSSFEIEREKPTVARMERFIKIVTEVATHSALDKASLVSIQNAMMDPRFQDPDYRATQNYVGEVDYNFQPKLHFISPRPQDVPGLMGCLLDCLNELLGSDVHPVIIATIISFGFVFIHPFEDGNGRIHRYLVHYILLHGKFTPDDLIFPISATMLIDLKSYDRILESYSKPLLKLIKEYDLTELGVITVNQDTCYLYQYIDYTKMAEYLFACIEKTINTTFKEELDYIVLYDTLRGKIQDIIDLPDKQLCLMANILIRNEGKLANTKRKIFFAMLTDDEIGDIERAYASCIS